MSSAAPAPTLLIVDDDEGLLYLLEAALRNESLEVATARSGSEALTWLDRHSADLLLLDLKLQDIGGREFVSKLADMGRLLPFIIITGQGDERTAVEMMKRGALDYIVKTANFLEFVPAVVRWGLVQIAKERHLAAVEAQARLGQTIVEQAYDAVMITTTDPVDPEIIYFNTAFSTLTGCGPAELTNARLSQLEDLTGPWPDFRAALQSREMFRGELFLQHRQHGRRIADGNFRPVVDAQGTATHWAVILHDLTMRRKLEQELLENSECERRRFGQDLHDGIGQRLTAIELFSHALLTEVQRQAPGLAKPFSELGRELRETIRQTRALSHGLSPVATEAEGLMEALRELAKSTRSLTKIDCRFEGNPPVLVADANAATHLYRIAQEAVNNALKHGHPTRIRLSLTRQGDQVKLKVSDNGEGITKSLESVDGMGVRVMQYRAGLIGAKLQITSRPHKGVTISCLFGKRS